MARAVMIGAGNIGRGFIGQLLENAGIHVVFADINKAVIDEINRGSGYTVHIMDDQCKEVLVSNISGVDSTSSAMIEEFQSCDLIATAVGLSVLSKVASSIAKGIVSRKNRGCTQSLNVIACENAVRASSILKQAVYTLLSPDEQRYCDQYVGFPDCTVDRIVPIIKCANPIDVMVESHFEWVVDKTAIRGNLPHVPAMMIVENLQAYIERKLYILNCGHAITAYLGYHKGYKTIQEAIRDEEIHAIVRGALLESGHALSQKHGIHPREQELYIDAVLTRFANPHFADDVSRVGREPLRKLASEDRLIQPAMLSVAHGNPAPNLIIGIVAALRYDNPADPQCGQIQEMIAHLGLKETLHQVSGIGHDEPIANDIAMVYDAVRFFSHDETKVHVA